MVKWMIILNQVNSGNLIKFHLITNEEDITNFLEWAMAVEDQKLAKDLAKDKSLLIPVETWVANKNELPF